MAKKFRDAAGRPAAPVLAAPHASGGAASPGAAVQEDELWTAARVARDLGVAVGVIEELQASACVAGEDFVQAHGTPVFTEAGVRKIRERVAARMSTTAPEPAPAPAAQAPAIPQPRSEDLTVTRVFRWSHNVLADLPNGNEVVLSVKNAKHLMPGMVLRGCREGNGGWFYQGRLPRTMGERQMFFPAYQNAETKGQS